MKKDHTGRPDTFTEIFLEDIDVNSATLHHAIENLTCLTSYINGSLLQPHQKRILYLITAPWIKRNLKEEEIFAHSLPTETEIEQMDDETIAKNFPLLVDIWTKHAIIWDLLDNTEFLIEKEAAKLIHSGRGKYQEIKTALQQARQNFINACKKIVKDVVENPTQPKKRAWIKIYVRTMEEHFAFWDQSDFPRKEYADTPFFIDLTKLDLRKINLQNIPLKNANLKDSRLADSSLAGTEVSALQLSAAKEFRLVKDLSPQLLLETQNEQYGRWQHRLEQRAKKFNALREKMDASNPNKKLYTNQVLSEFEFFTQFYRSLIEQKGWLDKHCAQNSQNFDKALFVDLTTEQQNLIYPQLENFEREETCLRHKIMSEIYKGRCDLCVVYFKEIDNSLKADSLDKALQQFAELLILRQSDKGNSPLPPNLDATTLMIRNNLLNRALLLMNNFLISPAETKETQEKLVQTLKQIDSIVNHTLQWPLALRLEAAINKARRDWIRYRIEFEIAQGNLQQAETLIEKFLSDAEIVRQGERCFNELKNYSIDFTRKFLETAAKEQGTIYISTQKDYIIFGLDGSVYRGALLNEQTAAAKELERLLKHPKYKKSILAKAAKESYIHLKFDLKLQIIEKHLQNNQLERARDKMKNIITIATKQKYILDLREKFDFSIPEFWVGLPIQGVRMYLDPKQMLALGERQLQYNDALFCAIKNGNLEEVQYGIEHFSWKANLRNQKGCTSVIFACLQGYYDIALYLFEQGGEALKITLPGKADINPLDKLIQKKYRENRACYKPIILWLISKGLELEPKNALVLNDRELFKTSLAQLADDDSKKEKVLELLLTAVTEGSDTVVSWMLKKQEEYKICVSSFPVIEAKRGFFPLSKVEIIAVPPVPPLLHIACRKGHVAIVSILLKDKNTTGADSNKQSALLYLAHSFWEEYPLSGKNPFKFQALYEKWKCIATILCTKGAQHDLDTWLLFNENLEKIEQYITRGTLNNCDTKGNTPLHIAVKTWNIKLVRFLIGKNIPIDLVNSAQETPLYLACELGHIGIVTCLLEAGANPDGPRRNDGPREEWTEDEKRQIIELADSLPDIKSFLDKKPLVLKKPTPFQCAILNKHAAIVEVLCQNNANLERKYQGKTALHLAIHRRDTDSVKILLRYGAQIFAQNKMGEWPLHAAASARDDEITILLLNAYVNRPTPHKEDATQKAVFTRLEKLEAKEKFCDAVEQWAKGFRQELHSSESDAAESVIMPTAHSSASSLRLSLSSSSSCSFSPLSSSLLSSSCSMFPPAKSTPVKPLGLGFETPLQEHLQKEDDSETNLNIYSDDEEFPYNSLPEAIEPFYVIPSSPEEMEKEEEDFTDYYSAYRRR